MAIAGTIPVDKWLAKIKRRSDVGCRLCKRAREQHGASTENLPEETYGHINSAFCDGMATIVTAAHHFIRNICMLACKLHKHQWVSSGLLRLIKIRCGTVIVAGRRVWADLQQRIIDGKGSKNWKNDLCERVWKGTRWFWPENVLWKSFLESEARWHGD